MTKTELERLLATTLQHRAEDAMTQTDTHQQLDELVMGLDRATDRRRQSRTAIGVAAAAALAGALLWWPNGEDATPSPAPPSPSESVTRAEMVGQRFMTAYTTFDPERAVSYLTEDVYTAGFGPFPAAEGIHRTNKLMQATDFRMQDVECTQIDTLATGAEQVICLVTAHDMGSDLLGRGPYENALFEFHVRGNKIEVATMNFVDPPSAWLDRTKEPGPFWTWLRETHPADEALLDAWRDPASDAATVNRSLRLWERRVDEYVDAVQAGEAE